MPVHCVALATLECIRKKFINLIAVERQRTILFFGTASMHTHNIYIHMYQHAFAFNKRGESRKFMQDMPGVRKNHYA